jgi:hypothetical protein
MIHLRQNENSTHEPIRSDPDRPRDGLMTQTNIKQSKARVALPTNGLCVGGCVWECVWGSVCVGVCVWECVCGSVCVGVCVCVAHVVL